MRLDALNSAIKSTIEIFAALSVPSQYLKSKVYFKEGRSRVGSVSCASWNWFKSNFVVLQKEVSAKSTKSITDYVINLSGTSLAERLILRQVLLDNKQSLDTTQLTSPLKSMPGPG